MLIEELFQNIEGIAIFGSKKTKIHGIASHSKQVQRGDLFIARRGIISDGKMHVQEALQAGAIAIFSSEYNPLLQNDVVQIVHADVGEMEYEIAARFYGYPANQLHCIGITGTNGKTTCAYLIRHLFEQLNGRCGLIGTVETIAGNYHLPPTLTTPSPVTLQKILAKIVEEKSCGIVMEVSSQGLDQGRAKGISFEIAVLTNVTQDHLDYHGSMENYAAAKAKLFDSLAKTATAIVNIDDPWSEVVTKNCLGRRITYGMGSDCALQATDLTFSMSGTTFHVHFGKESSPIYTCLIGKFNVLNCLAGIGAMLSLGYPLQKIAECLRSFQGPPGRLEKIANSKGIHIFVDYAHTPDALANVFQTLNEIKEGRLITVFGCGGDRDHGKRPKMGAIVEKNSNISFVTSDNPRTEDPMRIIQEIIQGCQNPNSLYVEPDRASAIALAIKSAQPKDILLIAGKGHEDYQQIGLQKFPFDDRKVARELSLS